MYHPTGQQSWLTGNQFISQAGDTTNIAASAKAIRNPVGLSRFRFQSGVSFLPAYRSRRAESYRLSPRPESYGFARTPDSRFFKEEP